MGSGKRRYGNEGESSIKQEEARPLVGVEFLGQTHNPNPSENAWSETSAFHHLMSSEPNVFPDLFLHKALKIFHSYRPRGCQYMKDYRGLTLRCSSLLFFLSLSLSRSCRSTPGLLSQRGGFRG